MTNKDLLYRYFSNSLTEKELIDFNRKLETDNTFKAEFEFENNLKQAIKKTNSNALKAKLKTFESKISTKESKEAKPKFNWRIAASIVFLLGASWFGYNSFFGTNYNKLYATNFKEYPNTVYKITRGDTINSIEREAFVAYETQDFNLAIAKFNALQSTKPYHNFYVAHSYLGIENLDKAKRLFKKEIKNESSFIAEAHWYLALINIKQQNKIDAIKNLKVLTLNYNYKAQEAKKILKNLE